MPPSTWRVSASMRRLNILEAQVAIPSNDRFDRSRSRMSGSDPRVTTRRSASAYGSGRSSTAFTTLKMAVVAPIPSASVSTATSVKPGVLRKARMA